MERRKFLGKAALAIPVTVIPSVYGTPAAARGALFSATLSDDLLQAPLNRMGLPEEMQGDIAALGRIVVRLSEDSQFAARFSSSPKMALTEMGLEGAVDETDPVIQVFRAITDPRLKAALATADYGAFMKELKRRGLLDMPSKADLRDRFRQMYLSDYRKFESSMSQVMAARPDLMELLKSSEKLHALVSSATATGATSSPVSPFGSTRAASIVEPGETIPLVLVSWVAVALMVLLGAMAWVVSVVEVKTQVGTSPPPPPPPPPSGAYDGARSLALSERSNMAAQAFDARQKLTAIVGKQTATDLRRAATVAALLGRPDLAVEARRKVLDLHIEAAVDAAIQINAAQIQKDKVPEFKRRLREVVRAAAGV